MTPCQMAVIAFKKLIFAVYEMFVFYLISFFKTFWQCARILGFHPVITKLCDTQQVIEPLQALFPNL